MRDGISPRERAMRKILIVSLLFLGLASFPLTSAAQHAGMAPAMHVAPMHAVPAPVGGVHMAYARPAAHPSSQIRSGIHSGYGAHPVGRPIVSSTPPSPKAAWYPGLPPSSIALPPSSIAPIPPFVPNTPGIFPGSIFFSHSCLSPFNCYGRGSGFLTSGVIIPFGGFGGFYIPVPYYEPSAPEDEENAQNNANAPEQTQDNGEPQNQQAVAEQQATAPPAAPSYYSSSERPVYDYVFVKRDGTKIFAVAYSLTKDKVQYVTREGLRRTLPLDAIDYDATQKSNEERGNTINLPTPPPAAVA